MGLETNTLVIGLIAIINIISLFITYRTLNTIESKKRILVVAILILVMYVISYVFYGICASGVNNVIVNKSRQLLIFTILPINLICIGMPFVSIMTKVQEKNRDDKWGVKFVAWIIVVILIIMFESGFISSSLDMAVNSLNM